jgi:hypothetical protein
LPSRTVDPPPSRRRLHLAAAIVSLAAIAVMTLRPGAPETVTPQGICVFCGSTGGQDFFDNILLFVPFGFFLRAAGVGRWRVIAAAVATTVFVEAMQLRVVVGRDASLGDVLSNSLGGVLGVLLAERWRTLLFPTARLARRLAVAAALAWLAVLATTAWALAPSLLERRPAFVQWAPMSPAWSRFHGQVLDASLGGRAIGPTLPMSPAGGYLDDDGAVRLASLVRNGNVRPSFAPIVRVASPGGPDGTEELVALGEDGCDLTLHVRMRVTDVRFRAPSVTVPRVFPCGDATDAERGVAEGDTTRIMGELTADGWLRVGARWGERGASERAVRLSPVMGWSFFLPWGLRFGVTPHHWLDALWLAGLLLPAAYFGARGTSGRRRRAQLVGLAASLTALVALGLVVVPAVSTLAPGGTLHWLACAVGIVAGLALGARPSGRPERPLAETRRV